MMGHSLSGFWVQRAAMEGLIQVGELHNGGTLAEPGTYWLSGSKRNREMQSIIMDGTPYNAYLDRYIHRSPSLNAAQISSPMLIEAGEKDLVLSLEYFAALRTFDRSVDLFVYPDEGHVFHRPSNRLASMQRNIDWFSYWLLGRKTALSGDDQQYYRWDIMRKKQCARHDSHNRAWYCS
jgi:hypothetical protein